MTTTGSINVNLVLDVETCCNCGCVFGIERSMRNRLKETHNSFCCPNGHSQHYTVKTEAEKLRDLLSFETRRRENAESNARYYSERTQAKERQLSAAKGQITKIKNRIGNGVCPCCNRTFTNLGRHMHKMHPDFSKQMQESDE